MNLIKVEQDDDETFVLELSRREVEHLVVIMRSGVAWHSGQSIEGELSDNNYRGRFAKDITYAVGAAFDTELLWQIKDYE